MRAQLVAMGLCLVACSARVEAIELPPPVVDASPDVAIDHVVAPVVDAGHEPDVVTLTTCPEAADPCVFKDALRLCQFEGPGRWGCDPDGGTWVALEASPCTEYCR